MRFDAGSKLGFLLSKHTNDASGDLVMNDCLVVFADDVDSKFLIKEMCIRGRGERGGRKGRGIARKV
jgi:hypothetical protein